MTCGRSVFFFLASSTHKTDRYNIAEILLKVALNTIALTRIKLKVSITNKLTYRKSHNVFARYNIEHKILSETYELTQTPNPTKHNTLLSHFWDRPVPIFSDARFSYLAHVQEKKIRAFNRQMHAVQFMSTAPPPFPPKENKNTELLFWLTWRGNNSHCLHVYMIVC